MAWYGEQPIEEGHILTESKIDVIMVTSYLEDIEENTMPTNPTSYSGWISYLLRSQPKSVGDVYSLCSKYTCQNCLCLVQCVVTLHSVQMN